MSHKFGQHDEQFMRLALSLAEKAADLGEVPVGAVLVLQGEIVGQGYNQPISAKDTTAHAEIVALRQACETLDNYRLPDSTIYVSLEPCAMCAGAMVHARVKRVVFAAHEPRAGAAGSALAVLNNPKFNHRCTVEFGLFANDSSRLLKSFFQRRRS